MAPLHKQVPVTIFGIGIFEVDEGVAPLIRALWGKGYRTNGSCEHQPGTPVAWVGFEKKAEAQRFAGLIDGEYFEPGPEDFAACSDDIQTQASWAAVAFPASALATVTAKVEAS